ncbi:unnamed protein product, partial [Discosporangium mesarthrocarpum]
AGVGAEDWAVGGVEVPVLDPNWVPRFFHDEARLIDGDPEDGKKFPDLDALGALQASEGVLGERLVTLVHRCVQKRREARRLQNHHTMKLKAYHHTMKPKAYHRRGQQQQGDQEVTNTALVSAADTNDALSAPILGRVLRSGARAETRDGARALGAAAGGAGQ